MCVGGKQWGCGFSFFCFALSQSYRLRQCVAEVLLAESPNASVIVGGDLNEGPGSGFFEEYYGLINLLDALLGSRFYGTETL